MNYEEVLAKSFAPDGWYRRAGNPKTGVGDSLTDLACLAFLNPQYAIKHLEACQLPSGQMRRHPDRLNLPESDPRADFSRDHCISVCFASLHCKDNSVAKKLFWFVLRNRGRFCSGNIGQSMVNVGVFAALLRVAYPMLTPLAAILYLFHLMVLYYTVSRTTAGYVLILHAEHALLMQECGIPKFLIKPLLRKVLDKQPENLFYIWAYKQACGQKLSQLEYERLLKLWDKWQSGKCGTNWLWTDPSDGRLGTGVDLLYLMELNKGEWFK